MNIKRYLLLLALCVLSQRGAAADPDANGVLRTPIPDKLVVLTFDDACASGYTVAAPILKSLGFNGTYYVCDFDSFKTRKDWYMTWRQMRALADDGFEIGNHTVGHGGGLGNYLRMEDELLANNCPKPTTVCWPLYQVVSGICPELAAQGYLFGRGGHERPYRPTVDNPFDVPSFTIKDGLPIKNFIKQVQQACQGQVVVLTFHGVPDMEHRGVSLEPETFRGMMQYLKDNHYQCIAMRDMARYIDPAKAAKLPPTASNLKPGGPGPTVKDDKPYVAVAAKDIQNFAFPGLPPVRVSKTSISVTVPYATDVTALAPGITVSPDATVAPASGSSRDFTKPQSYTVTGKDGSTKAYSVTVNRAAVSKAKGMLTFVLPGSLSTTISGPRIGVYVPPNMDVTALAPTFTLPPFAKAVPASGTPRNFAKPQTYTITAQDGTQQVCTVTVLKSDKPHTFTWLGSEGGGWSDVSKWANHPGTGSAPNAAGQSDYILHFNPVGKCAVANDLKEGFLLNHLDLSPGNGLTLSGNGIALTTNEFTGTLPTVHVLGKPLIATPLRLVSDVAVNLVPAGQLTIRGLISGTGGLIFNGANGNASGDINGGPDQNYSNLSIDNPNNSYSGGTILNGGTLRLVSNQGLGTGPVTLNDGAGLVTGPDNAANPLILNGGTIDAGSVNWNAPITLNGIVKIAGNHLNFNKVSGAMGGPGGFMQVGTWGAFGRVNAGEVYLWGVNTYTGPTTVRQGTLFVKKAASLYNADKAQWIPAKISVHPAATLVISAGGPGEFTGAQVGTLLGNLAALVNDNGLMGRSIFCVDTANAIKPVTVSADITDSKGPGGGAFVLKKSGTGTLQLSGNNTYTGQTILEGGTLSVASLNSSAKGRVSSSLGAPTNVEAGEIVIGCGDGECALVYTGTGETSDRVMNLAGKNATVTFDQSGPGLLKLTSPFVISGYGADKIIALKGDTAGKGEIAGAIVNPHDRFGKATTSVIKSGAGTWALSGTNRYTGPTKVVKGTLLLANACSLDEKTEVYISEGATLELNFQGEMRIGKLYLGGKLQPVGTYSVRNTPKFIKGNGALKNN